MTTIPYTPAEVKTLVAFHKANKPNPIPEATVHFVADDGGDVQAEMRPLAVELLRQAAARSKRTDNELILVALGSRPDLGSDAAHAAAMLYAARAGTLDAQAPEDVERAAATLAECATA